MPFQIVHRDITQMQCDAIVNPTDRYFSGSGGTDYCIHQKAGNALKHALADVDPLQTGDVCLTEGFNLPCRYIIHTIGPVWQGGKNNEAVLLRSCYLNALLTAQNNKLSSVAFPLISAGTFGFPKDRVLRIAMDAIADFLNVSDSDMDVTVCILDRNAFAVSREIALKEYLAETVTPETSYKTTLLLGDTCCLQESDAPTTRLKGVDLAPAPPKSHSVSCAPPLSPEGLSDWINQQDDTFAVTLFKLIDKKGITDVQCYKRANISRKTFSKINTDKYYKPSKATVLAFAISLELTLEETEHLLKTVGFSLSHSNTFDMIIEFFIQNQMYDIFEINAALYQYDQPCLGC